MLRFLAFFLCLWCFSAAHPIAVAAKPTAILTATRPFKGLVRRDLAEQAANVAAFLAAINEASRALALHPDLQFLSQHSKGNPLWLPDLQGLVLRLYKTTLIAQGAQGFPPELEAVSEFTVAPKEPLRALLVQALEQPEYTTLYAFVGKRLQELLAVYDTAAPAALAVSPKSQTGQERVLPVQFAVRAMRGTQLFIDLLPRLQTVWSQPEETLVALNEAGRLDPQNPFIMTAKAEIYMQLDRPAEAQRLAADALARFSQYARAHNVKGAALLRQRLPALAVAAFTQAITIAPHHAPYYMHRAAANLVQEEIDAMCDDFYKACSLQDCEGLEWARNVNKCL